MLWPHLYRKEKWLFQKLLQPISTEAHGEHLCLQKLLLDKSTRPSPSPHKPSELLQLGHPGLRNTFDTDVFIDVFYWSGEENGCVEMNVSAIPVAIMSRSRRLAVLGRSQSLGLGTVWIMTALKKSTNTRRLKTLSETRKVELLSYADEVPVEGKQVFMQNDGGCMKNEGRRTNINPHIQRYSQCYCTLISI